jgi:antitoxin component YwqK of YwqJK toxin-antitoxin module
MLKTIEAYYENGKIKITCYFENFIKLTGI